MKNALFKYYYFLFLTLVSLSLSAQYGNDIWYFGEHAGIDFTGASPAALTNGACQAYDNTSTITDTNGNLIFYTNGVQAWDKNHNQMPNGNNLGSTLSSGQSALIVPQPNSSKYYIFTVGYASGDKFRYSVVDMSLNGGNGSVISKANILLNNGSTEKIDAIYNPADTSFWVMTHAWNSNSFYCYKINSNGLQPNPVVSSIGSTYSGGNPTGYNAIGQMSFSKDGTKLASMIYTDQKIEIFDFNITTGQLSNPVILTNINNPWGIAFSFSNQYLYYTEWYGDKVYQMDISSGNPSTIISTKTVVGTATFSTPTPYNYKIGYLEYGPDSVLYVAKFGQNYISGIMHPDLQGTNCGFVDNAISLGTKTCNAGLSRVAVYYYPQSQPCSYDYYDSVYVCFGDSALVNGNYYTAPNLIIDSLVDVNGCDSVLHTKLITVPLPQINLGPDTSLCQGDTILLIAGGNHISVYWSTGATGDTLVVSAGGTYAVHVTDSLCSNSDTVLVTDLSTTRINIYDTSICIGDNWQINLPVSNNYLWFDGNTSSSNTLGDSGTYWVQITDICKSYTDTFSLEVVDCNCKITVPNVFTPNGDGLNETFYPVVSCELDDFRLYIFNRWGKLLFETQDQHQSWDATYEGKPVPDGVYFYLIEYVHLHTSAKMRHITGSVTVLR